MPVNSQTAAEPFVMTAEAEEQGQWMHALAHRLFPICRSITGNGVRESLEILREYLPGMTTHEVPTGTRCFDWTIPKEWNIRGAYVEAPDGTRVVDFADHNLHVVSYSVPIDCEMELEELDTHLFSLPDQPEAIPYVTSYYREFWGFCLAHNVRQGLKPGRYRVVIDSWLEPGSLSYGELILPGPSTEEILVSTYVCHPSMANNELSGPILGAALARWLSGRDRRYTYRFVFVPETVGAICYLSRNLEQMRANTVAGFVLTCVGDELAWSFMPSREGGTLADRAALHVLDRSLPTFDRYSFLQRGSDERQYCSPGIDLPVCSVMRSKYMTFPQYHTSLDDLSFVTARGLGESFQMHQRVLETLEGNCRPVTKVLGEPKMSDRGLRPTLGRLGSALSTMTMMNLIVYSDGKRDLIEIADLIGADAWTLHEVALQMRDAGILDLTETAGIQRGITT